MKKLLMIAAMAMFATVACDKTDEPVNPDAPDVTMTAPTEVEVGKTINITATLSKAAEGDVTVKAVSADAAVLTVADITIAKGSLSGTAIVTGVKEGTAKVSFTSTTATVKTAELSIKVIPAGVIPPKPIEYEFPTSAYGTYFGMSKAVIGTITLTSTCADGSEADKPLLGNDDFTIGGVSDDLTGTKVALTEGIAFTIFADNFTSTADKYDVYFYIDWNKDGNFDEATELVKVQKGVDGSTKTEITGTITIPATAVAESRCRIIVTNSEHDIENGVGTMDSGYMMDFTYTK